MNTRANTSCLKCGRTFTPLPGKAGKFCSQSCYQSHKNAPLSERFWRYVNKESGCWNWTGNTDKTRYGKIAKGGGKVKNLLAHRASWMIHFGPIPDGLDVLHHCDNPSCVNPEHLFLGTHADNMRDCVNKGRFCRGSMCAQSKITEEDVRAIRIARANGAAVCELAKQYGLAAVTVSHIANGRRWRHVI